MIRYAKLGSISTDTLRAVDLLDAFATELEYLVTRNKRMRGNGARRKLIREARAAQRKLDRAEPLSAETDRAANALDALTEALAEFAPPMTYFGAHPGDGADWGFWPAPEEAV